jgi:hypothetical protein
MNHISHGNNLNIRKHCIFSCKTISFLCFYSLEGNHCDFQRRVEYENNAAPEFAVLATNRSRYYYSAWNSARNLSLVTLQYSRVKFCPYGFVNMQTNIQGTETVSLQCKFVTAFRKLNKYASTRKSKFNIYVLKLKHIFLKIACEKASLWIQKLAGKLKTSSELQFELTIYTPCYSFNCLQLWNYFQRKHFVAYLTRCWRGLRDICMSVSDSLMKQMRVKSVTNV